MLLGFYFLEKEMQETLIFFLRYYGYKCLEALHLHILMIQTLYIVMQVFKGSYFSVGAASRHF